jgi:predicted transcriptional regulator
MKKNLSNSNKERILLFIQNNPGCYLRQIRSGLELSMGSVQYHSYHLQKVGRITSTKQGGYKLHFQSGVFQDHEKKIIQVLNQETPREIILFIIEQNNPTQTDIMNRLGISAPSVSWHVKRLIDFKIVDQFRDGKYKRYKLHANLIDPELIVKVLKRHHPNLWNKWSNRLAEMFLTLSDEE